MKISKQTKLRFEAIEYLVLWEGGVNASRLSRLFGVKPHVIVKAIADYRALHSDNLIYDAQDPEKIFIATDVFRPMYISRSWNAYINFVISIGNEHINQLYGDGTITELLTPLKGPIPSIVSTLLKAIRQSKSVRILYRSRSNPKGMEREIVPTALSNDGIRWHCRAYCCYRNRFSDFNLNRISESVIGNKVTLVDEDIEWATFVDIVVNAHPALDEDEKSLVLNDYGYDDKFTLRVRGALVDYTIQYYRLGRHPDTCSPKQHPLIVENSKELSPYFFEGDAQ